jgi:tRNA/tmRNA/rRNA uracil-C5-methylase (TrmA/RlmC/RlmD family)
MESVEITVDSLAYRGAGVGRKEGIVYFIPLSCPGDRVRAEIVRYDKRFREARIIEILSPSKYRVEPLCPLFGSCGGCAFQHVAYELQLKEKAGIAAETLGRAMSLPRPGVETAASPLAYGYRITARFAVSSGGKIGFKMQKSDEIVGVDRCPLLDDRLNARIPVMNESLKRLPASPSEVELTLLGDGTVQEAFLFPGVPVDPGFTQANAGVNELLKKTVREELIKRGEESARVLDLYAGNGNLSLQLADIAQTITGYETSQISVRKAAEAAKREGFSHARYAVSTVEEAIKRTAAGEYTCAIADPPRAGLASAARPLAELDIPLIIYISCVPHSMAKDLPEFARRGYELKRVIMFDMFPQSFHMETLAVLSRH